MAPIALAYQAYVKKFPPPIRMKEELEIDALKTTYIFASTHPSGGPLYELAFFHVKTYKTGKYMYETITISVISQ